MTIHGELTAEDWRHSRWEFIRPLLFGSLWQLLFVAALVAFFLYLHVSVILFLLIGLMPLIPRAFLLAEYPFLIRMSHSSLQDVLARADALPGPRTIEVDDTGLTITSPSLQKQINWNKSYRKFQIGRDYLLILESYHRYQIFPRRWFTPEQWTEFQEALKYGLTQRRWFWVY